MGTDGSIAPTPSSRNRKTVRVDFSHDLARSEASIVQIHCLLSMDLFTPQFAFIETLILVLGVSTAHSTPHVVLICSIESSDLSLNSDMGA